MPIAAPESVFYGGPVSTGPTEGDYHVVIADASLGTSSKGRPQLVLDLIVKDDPNHASREGKRLMKHFQSLADPAQDDEEKVKVMNGMFKRLLFEGFGLKWATENKALDARMFVSKTAWVRIAKKLNPQNGEERAQVVAAALTPDKLPVNKSTTEPANGKAIGARSRRG